MSSTEARQFAGGEYGEVEEELEELDEGHDGETEPQTKHTARVRDVLEQLKQRKTGLLDTSSVIKFCTVSYYGVSIETATDKGRSHRGYIFGVLYAHHLTQNNQIWHDTHHRDWTIFRGATPHLKPRCKVRAHRTV